MFNHLRRNSDLGFTLIELMVAILIIGILATIASPNLLGWINRYRVQAAMNSLEGAIKETQRQSMRLGNKCGININTNSHLIIGNPTNCLLSNRNIQDDINIRTNLSGNPPTITFSYRGNTTKMGTIVLSSSGTTFQNCFVISLGTGITRTGEYTGDQTGSVSSKKCKKNN